MKAIRAEAPFGKLVGGLFTLPLKIPIEFLVADAHPAGHIFAPGVYHVSHLSLCGVMLRQAAVAEARCCSDLSALRGDNAKKIFHLYREWDGFFQALARCIHIAKVPKEAKLLNVHEQR